MDAYWTVETRNIDLEGAQSRDMSYFHQSCGDWLHVPVDRVVPRESEPNLVFRKLDPIFEPCQRARWIVEFRQGRLRRADRIPFNADAVIRYNIRSTRMEARFSFCRARKRVDLRVGQELHPCREPMWRRRQFTTSSHVVAQTDSTNGRLLGEDATSTESCADQHTVASAA